MNELVQQIISRTGISESQARTAIDMVVSHLKGRLPDAVSSHLESALNSEGSGHTGMDIGNLFGGKKSA